MSWHSFAIKLHRIRAASLIYPQIAKFMGSTWGPPGPCRPQMGPISAPWTLLSGSPFHSYWWPMWIAIIDDDSQHCVHWWPGMGRSPSFCRHNAYHSKYMYIYTYIPNLSITRVNPETTGHFLFQNAILFSNYYCCMRLFQYNSYLEHNMNRRSSDCNLKRWPPICIIRLHFKYAQWKLNCIYL